jgi:hypothetical protein
VIYSSYRSYIFVILKIIKISKCKEVNKRDIHLTCLIDLNLILLLINKTIIIRYSHVF